MGDSTKGRGALICFPSQLGRATTSGLAEAPISFVVAFSDEKDAARR